MAFGINSVVRAYNIYKDIWSAEIDSELPYCADSDNCECCGSDEWHTRGRPRAIENIFLFVICFYAILE